MRLLSILDKFGLTRLAKMQNFKGGNLFINMSPNSKIAIERHLSRILLCERTLRQSKTKTKERKDSLKTEINRRKYQLLSIGIDIDNPKNSGV